MKILLVEDEKNLAFILSETLKRESYIVDVVYNGIDGLDYASTGVYDIIILDVMLPYLDGFQVLKELRKNKITSVVLMLTAKSEVEDKINGLDSGADDYLTKPFVTKELLARIRALSRRNHQEYIGNIFTFGDISIDKNTHEMIKNTDKIKLTPKEYQIMEMFILNKGNVITKDRFIQKIWGYDTDVEYNSIEVYISFIRKKLIAISSNLKITSVRNTGYTFGGTNE